MGYSASHMHGDGVSESGRGVRRARRATAGAAPPSTGARLDGELLEGDAGDAVRARPPEPPLADVIPIARARRPPPAWLVDGEPLRCLKLIDLTRLEHRFAAAPTKHPTREDRPATWTRLLARRLVDAPAGLAAAPVAPGTPLDKLPSRTPRLAKLRLFRAFKLLGPLKHEAAASVDEASGLPSVSARLRAIASALRL